VGKFKRLRRSAYVELLKPGNLLVKRRWTRSSASISCFRHGDQATELLSASGFRSDVSSGFRSVNVFKPFHGTYGAQILVS